MALGEDLNIGRESSGILSQQFQMAADARIKIDGPGLNASADNTQTIKVAEAGNIKTVTPAQSAGPFAGLPATEENKLALKAYNDGMKAGTPWLELKMLIPK